MLSCWAFDPVYAGGICCREEDKKLKEGGKEAFIDRQKFQILASSVFKQPEMHPLGCGRRFPVPYSERCLEERRRRVR